MKSFEPRLGTKCGWVLEHDEYGLVPPTADWSTFLVITDVQAGSRGGVVPVIGEGQTVTRSSLLRGA